MTTVIVADGEERRHSQIDVGEDILVVYESVQPNAGSQSVRGRVIGVEGEARWILACKEDDNALTRQCYKLTTSDFSSYKTREFAEIDDDDGYGHKPDPQTYQKIGEPEMVYPASDIQISRSRPQDSNPFSEVMMRTPRVEKFIGRPKRRHTFGSKCEALCHRLFDANGGAECDYEFEIPTTDTEPNHAITDDGINLWYKVNRGISIVLDGEAYDPLQRS